jgi:hypothetical protein
MRRRYSLLTLLLVCSMSFNIEEPTTLTARVGSLPSVSAQFPGFQLELHWDQSGDLWVFSPFYEWNITGGRGISQSASMSESYLVQSLGQDSLRLVNELFLTRPDQAIISAKIIFESPQEAVVYLEQASAGFIEGLTLTFRAWDGLITLSHYWQGSQAPDLPVPHVVLNRMSAESSHLHSGTLPVITSALDPHPLVYGLSYDPSLDRGFALLQPPQERQYALMSFPDCFASSGSISSPELDQECQRRGSQPAGLALGRRYLLLYEGAGDNPFAPLELLSSRLQLALPDLNIASIGRTPRYDYDQPKNRPYSGDLVTFSARVANRGGAPTGRFSYVWSVNGIPSASGSYSNIDPGEIVEINLEWIFEDGPHTVSLSLDGDNHIAEISEANNHLSVRTDALALGLWVEQSKYDWFNTHQVQLGLSGVSWDDWAQRQILAWNQIFAQALHPLTPQGVLDRVRLDKVVVVPDGSLNGPFPSNYPAPDDKTVDLMWGFVCEGVGACSFRSNYGPFYLESQAALILDYALLHELGHARYLDDLYGINLVADVAYLTTDVGPGDTLLHVDRDVEGVDAFALPAYLALNGELLICRSARGSQFSSCERGAEGTLRRAHSKGSHLNRAAVRLQDGYGRLVMGSSALPLLGWTDHLYYNRYQEDIMSGGTVYGQHSAFAFNRIAGRRPVCGNYNRPCNLGDYQNDIPGQNILVLLKNGQPAAGAKVEVYKAKEYAHIWYGKEFYGPPDAVYTASSSGEVEIGRFPFSNGAEVVNEYNRLLLLKITDGSAVSYHFFDVTQANEAYWGGQVKSAYYPIPLPSTGGADAWIAAPLAVTGQSVGQVVFEVSYGNYGLSKAENLLLTLIFDPRLELEGASIPPDHQSSGQATWMLGSLLSMDSDNISITLQLPEGEPGESYPATLELLTDNYDELPGNNILEFMVILDDEPALP